MLATNGAFFDWLMDMLRGLAGIRTPYMDTFMSGVTLLGQEALALIAAEILFFCYSKRAGYKFLFMFHFGTILNQMLKFIFMIPRPWMIDKDFEIVESARAAATGWSFPSGHTQSAAMVYFGLAREVKKLWAFLGAGLLVLLIGFSRMYLGVHTLLDVGVALILGILVLLLGEVLFSRFGDSEVFPTVIFGITTALSLAFLIVLLAVDNSELRADNIGTAATLFGVGFGVFAGSILERKYIKFDTKAVWWVQMIKVALGLAIMLGIRMGLKPLFALITDSPLMNAPRYFLMSFVGTGVYPASFKVLNKLEKRH